MHMRADEAEVDHVEGSGALNFLAIDDLAVAHEGEMADPAGIVALPTTDTGKPIFPTFDRSSSDSFLRQV